MASNYDFSIDQGSDFRMPIELKNSDGTATDLSGYKVQMQLRRRVQSVDVDDSLSTEDGRIELVPKSGKFVLIFPHAVTEKLSGEYFYDIELISSEGLIRRILQGKISLDPEVTRWQTP